MVSRGVLRSERLQYLDQPLEEIHEKAFTNCFASSVSDRRAQ